MVMIDYSEHFWGDRHIGYHVLYENIKRGEDAVQDMSIFVKERVSWEDENLKFLNKNLSRVNSFIAANGPFAESWRTVKGTLELCSEIQTTQVKNLSDLSKNVVKYHDELVKSRKKLKEQDVIDAVNLMQTTTTCLQKAKETYSQRCGEVLNLKNENVQGKELFKAKNKLAKAYEEYKSYVEKYQQVRDNFEEKMLKTAKLFQAHDQSYLNQLKALMITFAKCVDDAQSAISQMTGDLVQSMENIDVENIMLRFVEEKATGTDRPQVVRWTDSDEIPAEFDIPAHLSSISAPSSSNSSAVVFCAPEQQQTVNDLLSLDSAWGGSSGTNNSRPKSPNETDSERDDQSAGTPAANVPQQFSSWLGRQKITQWRKKHSSHTNLSATSSDPASGVEVSAGFNDANKGGSFLKRYIKGKTSISESQNGDDMDPTRIQDAPRVDSEGFSIREDKPLEKDRWSSGSSSDEDELEFQTSKIKGMQIKPLNDSKMTMNSSVDEIRSAVGHIHLQRSTTLDKDPWGAISGAQSPFSQSLNTTLKPLRAAFTGDDNLNRKFSEFNFPMNTLPGGMEFSQSSNAAFGSSIARARPRSHTPNPQLSTAPAIPNRERKDSFLPDEGFPLSHSVGSMGSLANLGQWPPNEGSQSHSSSPLAFGEVRLTKIPIAIGVNEYIHAWFKPSESPTVRVFGTVMVSFPAAFLPMLQTASDAREPLQFTLQNAIQIKSVQPNKKLLADCNPSGLPKDSIEFCLSKSNLAVWAQDQLKAKPGAAFYNADLVRYELVSGFEAPVTLNAYWKTDLSQTDLRVDYTLNPNENTIKSPLINVTFEAPIDGEVDSFQSDPQAKWCGETNILTWSLTELTRHGEAAGSLKARLKLKKGPTTPANLSMQFQTSNTTASNAQVHLDSDRGYQLSLMRRKAVSGKYFCEPEIRS